MSSDGLALVADGMGGHPGGEIAANVAAGVIPAVFTGQSEDELEAAYAPRTRQSGTVRSPSPDWRAWAPRSARLVSSPNGQPPLVNVGDSRAYLWLRVG